MKTLFTTTYKKHVFRVDSSRKNRRPPRVAKAFAVGRSPLAKNLAEAQAGEAKVDLKNDV